MKRAVIFIILLHTIVVAQQESSTSTTLNPYLDAVKYLRSFRYLESDSMAAKFLKSMGFINVEKLKLSKLIVSKSPMITDFSWFAKTIATNSVCNPINHLGQEQWDSLRRVDKDSTFIKNIELPDSLFNTENPDWIVFFSGSIGKYFSAELFQWMNPANQDIIMTRGHVQQKYYDYCRFNAGLIFLFCVDNNGVVSPIDIAWIAHD